MRNPCNHRIVISRTTSPEPRAGFPGLANPATRSGASRINGGGALRLHCVFFYSFSSNPILLFDSINLNGFYRTLDAFVNDFSGMI